MMRIISAIAVFSGSNFGGHEDYAQGAAGLGAELARRGIRLVYGGTNKGLMGVLADAVLAGGGEAHGVITERLAAKGHGHPGLTVSETVNDMRARKRRMADLADAFIALPGGIGTLEELVEQLTWSQLGRHDKPIVLANIDGFWSPFMTLLKHMGEESFIRPGLEVTFNVVERAQDILPVAIEASRRAEAKSEAEIEARF